jgi:GT2 family glycosyltransferase
MTVLPVNSQADRPAVWLVISSFRNDESVSRILLDVQANSADLFERVLVVDSLGTGMIPALISERGWTNVEYRAEPYNLGSAGNLAERLKLAAAAGAAYAYAINHDGSVDRETVSLLIDYASAHPELGAVYPLRHLPHRSLYDVTGLSALPVPFRGTRSVPPQDTLDVAWSSSNGALYSLEPTRSGVTPWPDLWMCWEDMGYGWALARAGYPQRVLTGAIATDNYEYREHRIAGRTISVSDKPTWYAYYQVRNLLVITRRNHQSLLCHAVVGGRVVLEFVLTTLFRSHKRERFALLLAGVRDGLLGRTGKWVLP